MARVTDQTLAYAKRLRRHLTDAETILWSRLRVRAGGSPKFRRQHPIDPYIADFACVAAKLVIEIDGATHGTQEERIYDERRDAYFRERGWEIMRVANQTIYKHLDDCLDGIHRRVLARIEERRAGGAGPLHHSRPR